MPLTPDDVRSTAFRVVLRGYAVDEVDTFLDRVEQALSGLDDGAVAAPDHASAALVEDSGTRGLRVLQLAERTAEELLAEARRDADELLAAARAEALSTSAALSERSAHEIADLEKRVQELREQVRALEQLEHGHRERLVSLLTKQLSVVQREPLRSVSALAR